MCENIRVPPWGVNRSESIFSEHDHVAYQFKGNHEMQQHGSKLLTADTPRPQNEGVGSNGQNSTFSKHSCTPPTDPWYRVNRSRSTFSEQGRIAYHLKGSTKCSNMVANVLPADPTLGVKRSKFNFFRTMSCCI